MMAKPLKENGREELLAFQKRVRRQHSLRRITNRDFMFLEATVQKLIDRVESLDEIDDQFAGGILDGRS